MKYLMSERVAAFVRGLMRQGAPKSEPDAPRRAPRAQSRVDAFPAPYTVRWSASATRYGAWVIWLPGRDNDHRDNLLVVNAQPVTPSGVAVADNLPAGWYRIAVSETSTQIWLNVYVPDGDDENGYPRNPFAQFSNTSGGDQEGYTLHAILVARMTTDTSTTPPAKRVRQCVSSVVTIGGGGSAPATVYDGPFAPTFDQSGSLDGFDDCYFQYGGRTVLIGSGHCAMPGISSATEGFVVVEIPTTSSSYPSDATLGFYATLAALKAAQDDFSKFIIPIYKIAVSNNVISVALDMRRLATAVVYE